MKTAYRYFCRLEDALLVGLLLSLILLASSQILLRNLADAGWPWVEPLVRAGVMWLALLGASVASRSQRHITVDLLARGMKPRLRKYLERLTSLITALICSVICWHSYRFISDEMAYASEWILGLPSWAPMLILPYGFGVIALRYALAVFGWREYSHA